MLLGGASAGLVDVDLDAAEAVALAPTFLPATGARFGRRSTPASHWIYVASPLVPTEKFTDVAKDDDDVAAMLVELRSTGTQTVFPGSIHPSGELIEWVGEVDPARVVGLELRAAVVRLAAATLLARHWPDKGMRHQTALAAAGFLVRAGVDETAVVLIVTSAARIGGDPEWGDRRRAAVDTVAEAAAGGALTGAPTLVEVLRGDSDRAVARLRKWFGVRGERPHLSDEGNAQRFKQQHGELSRYCYAKRVWFHFEGTHWR